MNNEIEWFELEKQGNYPKYIRTVGKGSDGVLYISAALAEDKEYLVVAMASEDKANSVFYLEHYFVDSKWLAKTFPKCKELCQVAENNFCRF